MSHENVEIVRRAFETLADGGPEAMIQYATPDCIFYPDPAWVEALEYRGRDAFLAFNKTQLDAFGEFTLEVHEIRAVGERVLALTEFIRRATGSGVPIRQRAGHVLSDFRDGMIGQDRPFLRWDAAREYVGLEE